MHEKVEHLFPQENQRQNKLPLPLPSPSDSFQCKF